MSQSRTEEEDSLYERLGGSYAIAGAVDDIVDRLAHNETLNQNPGVRKFHEEAEMAGYKYHVTAWSIEATGGPAVYSARDMEEAHIDLGLTDYEFDVTHRQIEQSLDQVGVPKTEKKEFMGIIEDYRNMVVDDREFDEAPPFVGQSGADDD